MEPQNRKPTLLCRLISIPRVRWSRVADRLQTHPEEASDYLQGRILLVAILARGMDVYPPAAIVEKFIEAYPPAIWSSRRSLGGTPLETACFRRAPIPVLKVLLDSRPSMSVDVEALNTLWLSYSGVFERSNINLADHVCETREGAEIWTKLHMLLRYCTDPRKSSSTWRGLHLASRSSTCSLDLFQLILSILSPTEARRTNASGQLPLHSLALAANDQISPKEKLDLLLEAYPEAVWIRDSDGLLPIHVAAIAGRHEDFVDALVVSAPDTLCRRDDKEHLFPFQLAASSSQASISLVYRLLRAAPHLVRVDNGVKPPQVDKECFSSIRTVSSDVSDATQSFTSLLDSAALSGMSRGMLDLLSNHEEHSNAVWRVVHAASSLTRLHPDFLELAVRLHPEDLRHRDENGRLPLHIVSSLRPNLNDIDDGGDSREPKINTILRGFPGAVRSRDDTNSLPLHKAIIAGQSWTSLSTLIQAAPETLCRRDGVFFLYPFQIAACSPAAGLDEVFQLLVSAPHILSQQNR